MTTDRPHPDLPHPREPESHAAPDDASLERRSIRVTGVVQGVGFRPFVHNLAASVGLHGLVGNDSDGVFIEVEGPSGALNRFVESLTSDAPPMAHVESVESTSMPRSGLTGFRIVASEGSPGGRTFVSPDLRTCDACLTEMNDRNDRRHRYPFTNCTNCGPRYTIIESLPYDRPTTTMASFEMCAECRAEYEDPGSRRFHAQPNACPVCGPRLTLLSPTGIPMHGDPIEVTRAMIAAGSVVAVKGLGGFHLACDASSEAAVAQLRERKGRSDKPLAVMVADLATATTIVMLDDNERRLLTSRSRPIVLAKAVAGSPVSPNVAPGNEFLGLMLPYTPLHHLLLGPGDVWVMTSGNLSQEPIATDNDEALGRLAGVADAFLVHDRAIVVPVDDSVVRVIDSREVPVRRSRGYAPFPVKLPLEVAPTLAVGAELKATFCLAEGTEAFMSQHIGDMENLETLMAFERSVTHLQGLFDIDPEVLVTDLHPRYLSTRWADEHAGGRPVVRVQHHHAHLASLLAEHGELDRVIGFAFDGTGYGTDGTVWGGEVMVADLAGYERVGHLAPVPLPGGDAAVRRPYRMALSHLLSAGIEWSEDLPPVQACPPAERSVLVAQIDQGINTISTTSMGRLFDAVASLAGVRQAITYEGQAAIEFEGLVDEEADGEYRFRVGEEAPHILDPAPVLTAVVDDLRSGIPPAVIAARFHRGLATAMVEIAQQVRSNTGTSTVGCSGGVFQNATLTSAVTARMGAAGFRVLTHRQVPPNDGGLALGQAVVASMRS